MTAANHFVHSTRWLEALVDPNKTALRHARVDPVAPLSAASDSLHSVPPTPNSQPSVMNGDLVTISQTESQLVLPATLPVRILLLSAHSGITTTMSMMRDLQTRHYQGDVVLLHVCRHPAELKQANALQNAADSFPELSLLVHFDDLAGPFCAEALTLAVPDVNERTTWMCGPSGFMEMVQAYWRSRGLTIPLHCGSCVAAPTHTTHPETVTA